MQDLSIPNQPHPAGAAAYGYANILQINIYSNDVKAGYCRMFLESLERGETISHADKIAYLNDKVPNFVWRSSIGRQLRSWVYTRAKYITAEESARFACFDTDQHLEQDDLPVTKDVNQRVGLSRLTANVFQRVENQGLLSNLMSSFL